MKYRFILACALVSGCAISIPNANVITDVDQSQGQTINNGSVAISQNAPQEIHSTVAPASNGSVVVVNDHSTSVVNQQQTVINQQQNITNNNIVNSGVVVNGSVTDSVINQSGTVNQSTVATPSPSPSISPTPSPSPSSLPSPTPTPQPTPTVYRGVGNWNSAPINFSSGSHEVGVAMVQSSGNSYWAFIQDQESFNQGNVPTEASGKHLIIHAHSGPTRTQYASKVFTFGGGALPPGKYVLVVQQLSSSSKWVFCVEGNCDDVSP